MMACRRNSHVKDDKNQELREFLSYPGSLWNRIEASGMPWHATQKPQPSKFHATQNAVTLQRLRRVFGAARIETACGWQQPRYRLLVNSDCKDENAHCLLGSRRGAALPAPWEHSSNAAHNCCRNCG
jgi:hypothetical protein